MSCLCTVETILVLTCVYNLLQRESQKRNPILPPKMRGVYDEAGSLEAELWEIHQLETHLLDGEFADDFSDE